MSRRITAALTALTLTASLGVAGSALAGDQGRGDERPETAPGQQKKEEHAANPQAAPQGEAKGHDKQAAEEAGRDRPKPAEQQAAKQRAAERKAARQPGPKADARPDQARGPAPQSQAGKITICHATGSETNPYVQITISRNGLNGHDDHQDGRDIIPAPAEGCPGATTTTTTAVTPASTPRVEGVGITPAPQAVTPQAAGDVLGGFAESEEPRARVLPETAEARTERREAGAQAETTGSLPFTGLDLVLVIVLGLGALLAGVALHRSLSRSAG